MLGSNTTASGTSLNISILTAASHTIQGTKEQKSDHKECGTVCLPLVRLVSFHLQSETDLYLQVAELCPCKYNHVARAFCQTLG